MDLTIVIPAYNEAGRIEATLAAVAEYFSEDETAHEIVVIDDGSDDGTGAVVEEWLAGHRNRGHRTEVRVLRAPHQGKGAAVAEGVAAARGKYILMSDADLSTPIGEWGKLKERLDAGARIVIGSRQAEGARIEIRQPWLREHLGLWFGGLVGWLFPVGVIDSQCGFKAFEAGAARELFAGLVAAGYCFDVEILLRARARGLEIAEVPVRWRNHPDSKVRVVRDWPRVLIELWHIRMEMKRGMKRGMKPAGKGSG